jgi:alpha-tubulin N-acetyltransferase 1
VITTGSKFFGTDQRLYIKCQGCLFIGFIKVGKKHLFIYDELGQIKEMNPLCVLDFYTYEGCQRKGYGKEIFTAMLQCERIEPRKLGYDRPSFKFLNFLKKYYGLYDYVPQNNNFVVFNDYFKVDEQQQQQYTKLSYGNNNYNNDSSSNSSYKQNMFGNVDRMPMMYSKGNTHNENEYYSKGYNKTTKQQVHPQQQQQQQHTQPYTAMQYGNASNVHKTSKLPLPPYQYAKTSSEYGAFLNYGDFE